MIRFFLSCRPDVLPDVLPNAQVRVMCASLLACLLINPLCAEENRTPTHAIAMHGEATLPSSFSHLPYANPDAPKGGRLAVGFQGTFDSLNPFNLKAGSTAQGLIGNIFQPLMMRSLDEPFTLYGLIAQSVETDAARSYVTFRLNPLAHFSDGSPVTATDVVFTFNLLKTQGRPQQRAAFSLVRSVSTQDDRTVHYDLSGLDDREMPLTLALMPVLSSKKTDATRFNETSLDIPLGSGPYKIVSVRPGEKLVLERDANYWAKDLPIHAGLYNFDSIEISYFRDANTLFEAFKAGLLDYREETSPVRWLGAYDFPALKDGRILRESLPLGGPKGLEGFAFNTRRPLFQDVRLREALSLMFDFEWINKNLYDGLYRRTRSFFDESELASTGRPATEVERRLLAPYPGVVRSDILEGQWSPPVADGSGRDRRLAKQAIDLLEQSGYVIRDGVMTKSATGEPLTFEIMVQDRNQERLALNYAESLSRIGVKARVRSVDEVQYQRRRQKFDFDVMPGTWLTSASPGNEQRGRWGSASAAQEASFNLSGARSPALDALIASMLKADSELDFVSAVRAYDRVLLSGFYVLPFFHRSEQWIAYSSKLAHPARPPAFAAPLYGATLETWWRKAP